MGDWVPMEELLCTTAFLVGKGFRIVKLKAWGTWPKEWEHPTDNAVTLWEVTEEL